MINPTHLRIGNLVTKGSWGVIPIDLQSFQNIYNEENGYELYEPIPLTEEWLLKLGFYKSGYFWKIQTLQGTMSQKPSQITLVWAAASNKWKVCYPGNHTVYIGYVHQIQNFYFCFSGKELTLNNDYCP